MTRRPRRAAETSNDHHGQLHAASYDFLPGRNGFFGGYPLLNLLQEL